MNQLLIKQLKNRYNDPTIYKRFVIGVDRSKMRLSDVDQKEQKDIMDGPVFDQTEIAQRIDRDKLNLLEV